MRISDSPTQDQGTPDPLKAEGLDGWNVVLGSFHGSW